MDTMTGTTTRPVTFTQVDHRSRKVTATQTFPAGTTVYATENRRGGLSIRVCGSLFTQEVNGSTVEPA
jgi:hypothetical protein